MSIKLKPKNLPTSPGCYLFKDHRDHIIYIGKAKNLKKRVAQYWQKKDFDFKTRQLVREISDVDFFITNSEVEALLLEAKLIRDHKPKYNLDLKDAETADIKMTFTSPLCPFGPMLVEELKGKLISKGFKTVTVDIVFEPIWQPSQELRMMLGV